MTRIIIYDTVLGYTKEVAYQLGEILEEDNIVSIDDLTDTYKHVEQIYIGTYVKTGEVSKKTQKFFKSNKGLLLRKKVKVFCSSLDKTDFHRAIQETIDPELFYHMKIVNVGGRIDLSQISMLDRKKLKKYLGITKNTDTSNLDKLYELIKM